MESLMEDRLLVSVSARRLVWRERELSPRSGSLILFLALLVWRRNRTPANPWVTNQDLLKLLGRFDPKYSQRYLKKLRDEGLPLVVCKHSTTGPWSLAPQVERAMVEPLDWEPFPNSTQEERAQDVGSTLWAGEHALLALGHLLEADDYYFGGEWQNSLARASRVTEGGESPEPDFAVLALIKTLAVCQQSGMIEESWAVLKRLEACLLAGGERLPGFRHRVVIARARLLLERGRPEEASALLESLGVADCGDAYTLGQYYGLRGLVALRRLRAGSAGQEDAEVLRRGIDDSRRALVHQAAVNDYQGMASVTDNLGAFFVLAFARHLPPVVDGVLEQGLHWLVRSEWICHKFGVGGDSVSSRLSFIEAALLPSVGFPRVRRQTGELLKQFESLGALAQDTLREADRLDRPDERAEARRLLAHVLKGVNLPKAVDLLREAIDICLAAGLKAKTAMLRRELRGIGSSGV